MLNTKELLEVLELIKNINTLEIREIRKTVVALLSEPTGTAREVETESLKVQLHNLLGI